MLRIAADAGTVSNRKQPEEEAGMTVQELEDKVWALERIRITVRAAAGTKVGHYKYKNSAQASWRITELIEKRIAPLLKGQEVVVVMGDGAQPHGRTLLRSIRESYADK